MDDVCSKHISVQPDDQPCNLTAGVESERSIVYAIKRCSVCECAQYARTCGDRQAGSIHGTASKALKHAQPEKTRLDDVYDLTGLTTRTVLNGAGVRGALIDDARSWCSPPPAPAKQHATCLVPTSTCHTLESRASDGPDQHYAASNWAPPVALASVGFDLRNWVPVPRYCLQQWQTGNTEHAHAPVAIEALTCSWHPTNDTCADMETLSNCSIYKLLFEDGTCNSMNNGCAEHSAQCNPCIQVGVPAADTLHERTSGSQPVALNHDALFDTLSDNPECLGCACSMCRPGERTAAWACCAGSCTDQAYVLPKQQQQQRQQLRCPQVNHTADNGTLRMPDGDPTACRRPMAYLTSSGTISAAVNAPTAYGGTDSGVCTKDGIGGHEGFHVGYPLLLLAPADVEDNDCDESIRISTATSSMLSAPSVLLALGDSVTSAHSAKSHRPSQHMRPLWPPNKCDSQDSNGPSLVDHTISMLLKAADIPRQIQING